MPLWLRPKVIYLASQQELLGDIYQAQNNDDAAVKAYNNAWKLLSARNETRAVLALKMESLGLYPEPIEAQTSLIQQTASPESLDASDVNIDVSNDANDTSEINNSNEPAQQAQ